MTEQEQTPEIFVGDKSLGNYVKAVRYRVNEIGEASIVARGNFIRKAVDTAEIIKREDSPEGYEEADLKVVDVKTTTDEGENDDGSTFRVSKIVIDVEGVVEFAEDEEE